MNSYMYQFNVKTQPINGGGYLSIQNTQSLKGIFAVMILIHHLYQYSGVRDGLGFELIFQWMGYLSVGMFFFYTGYGLMLSSQKDGYLNTFLLKHVAPLYGFYVCLILIYTMYKTILGIDINPKKLVQSFLFGGTVVPLAWYLQAAFVMYLIYWLVFSNIKRDSARLGVMGATLAIFCASCHLCGLPRTWYESIFCILLGMVWFYKKEKIDEALKSKCILIFFSVTLLCVMFTLMQLRFGIIPKMLSAVTFSAMVTIFTYLAADIKIVDNKVTQFLGSYSLEIYVSQGFFLLLKRYTSILDSIYLFIIVTIIGTIAVAIVMKPIYEKTCGLCRRL